jgi:hypothetical protein
MFAGAVSSAATPLFPAKAAKKCRNRASVATITLEKAPVALAELVHHVTRGFHGNWRGAA